MPSDVDFSKIPILDYSLTSSPETKPRFLAQLRNAFVNVGFIYLSNHPVPATTVDTLISQIPKFFDLPEDEKDKVAMIHSPHFFGYIPLGRSHTYGALNLSAGFDFGTRYEDRWKKPDGEEDFRRVWGPSQWPDEAVLPGFRDACEDYFHRLAAFSYTFVSLIAESLDLPPNAFDRFFDKSEDMQHRGKLFKYFPVTNPNGYDNGSSAHCDVGFLTFLLQATHHNVLQVQNNAGEWISAPPVPGTLVINIGSALEFVTQGILRATMHRVVCPKFAPGEPPSARYSVPLFQSVALDVRLTDNIMEFPPHIAKLKPVSWTSQTGFDKLYTDEPGGLVRLIGRMEQYPEVAEKHWPVLFKKYYPDGINRGYQTHYTQLKRS